MEKVIVVFTVDERHDCYDFVGVNQLGNGIVGGSIYWDENQRDDYSALVNYGDEYGIEVSAHGFPMNEVVRQVLDKVGNFEVISTFEL